MLYKTKTYYHNLKEDHLDRRRVFKGSSGS